MTSWRISSLFGSIHFDGESRRWEAGCCVALSLAGGVGILWALRKHSSELRILDDGADLGNKASTREACCRPRKTTKCARSESIEIDGLLVPSWSFLGEQEDLDNADLFRTTLKEHLGVLSFMGNQKQCFARTMRDLNKLTRSNYADMIENLGLHIRPVIIASDYEPGYEGVGSTFTLYNKDGTSERIAPCPMEYECLKATAHITLGLAAILARYFEAPGAHGWQGKVQTFLAQIQTAKANLQCANMDDEITQVLMDFFGLAIDYCSSIVKKGEARHEDFTRFTATCAPCIHRAISKASELQVYADLAALMQWKKQLGHAWNECYFLIPVVWPVAGDNPRERMLRFLMDPSKVSTHLIKVEGAKSNSELLSTLGRVVGDRAVAHLVFGVDTPKGRDLNMALSTRRDLVSSGCVDGMLNFINDKPDEIAEAMPGVDAAHLKLLQEKASNGNIFELEAVRNMYKCPMSAKTFAQKLAQCPFQRRLTQSTQSPSEGSDGSLSDSPMASDDDAAVNAVHMQA